RLCHQPSREFLVDMRPKRDVPVRVWVRDADGLPDKAKDDIANADWIYNGQLAGIALRPSFDKIGGGEESDFQSQLKACFPSAPNKGTCCSAVLDSDYFVSGTINVYYGFGNGNFSCINDPWVPAVFIHDVPVLGDAAHELAHILGLAKNDNNS